MAGGYVKWDDPSGRRGSKDNMTPPGSKNSYTFLRGKWVWIEDEDDWKYYDWKEKKNPEWSAKRRLAKGDMADSFDEMKKNRPTMDEEDPQWDNAQKHKEVYEEYKQARERMRKYFGGTLPEALKKAKKIYGGD